MMNRKKNAASSSRREKEREGREWGEKRAPSSSSATTMNDVIDLDCDFGKIIQQALYNTQCPFKTLGLDPRNTIITGIINYYTHILSIIMIVADVKKRWAKLILTLHPDKVPFNWKGDKSNIMLLLGEAVQKVNEAKKKVIIIIIMVVVVL